MTYLSHIALLGLQASVVMVLLLGLYRARGKLGLGVLFIALGTFQYLQVISALSLYVEVAPTISVSPGSVVLFSASIVTVLLVYVLDDAAEARKLIYGIIIANVAVSLLAFLMGLHLRFAGATNVYNLPEAFFFQDPRILVVGTVTLFMDVVLVVIFYEMLSRHITSLYVRVALPLLAVLVFDTVVFVTGSFAERPEYWSILKSGIIGKAVSALFYGVVLAAYLRRHARVDRLRPESRFAFSDLFRALTAAERHVEPADSENRWARAIAGAGEALWEWDIESGAVWHSDRFWQLLGRKQSDKSSTFDEWLAVAHEDDREQLRAALTDESVDDIDHTYRANCADGSIRWIKCKAARLRDGERIVRVSGTHADVDSDVRLNRLKNDFVSIAGHELRTPLTSLGGSLKLISGGMAGELPDKARDLIAIAQRNADRLVRLVNDLLDLDKLSSGQLEIHREMVAADDLLDDAMSVNQGLEVELGVASRREVPPDLMLHADRERLVQVLVNLLSNAAKFSPEGGEIVLSVEQRDDFVRFRVQDQGPGIAEELRGRVFERFASSPPAARRGSKGARQKSSGLGLAIAKAIVEAHGGTIGFDSASSGTTFYFDVPAADDAGDA